MVLTMREMLVCLKASHTTGCSYCIYANDCPYPFDNEVDKWSKEIREENEHAFYDSIDNDQA